VSHDSRIKERRVDLRWWWYQCSERGRWSRLVLVCAHREKLSPCTTIWHPDTHTFTHSLSHSKGIHDQRAAYRTHIKTWKASGRFLAF